MGSLRKLRSHPALVHRTGLIQLSEEKIGCLYRPPSLSRRIDTGAGDSTGLHRDARSAGRPAEPFYRSESTTNVHPGADPAVAPRVRIGPVAADAVCQLDRQRAAWRLGQVNYAWGGRGWLS